MKFNQLTKVIATLLLVSYAATANAETFEARVAENQVMVMIQNQIQQINKMDESELRLQLELQAIDTKPIILN
jgi:hypothetical protein